MFATPCSVKSNKYHVRIGSYLSLLPPTRTRGNRMKSRMLYRITNQAVKIRGLVREEDNNKEDIRIPIRGTKS